MISKKMKYALKALVHMAKHQQQGTYIKANDIARTENIPKKFLEQILLDLKRGRIINSRQGAAGGYYFLRRPAEITLADIHRIIDGPIALVPCASLNFYEPCDDCPNVEVCQIKVALVSVREQTLAAMQNISVANLLQERQFAEAEASTAPEGEEDEK